MRQSKDVGDRWVIPGLRAHHPTAVSNNSVVFVEALYQTIDGTIRHNHRIGWGDPQAEMDFLWKMHRKERQVLGKTEQATNRPISHDESLIGKCVLHRLNVK